MPDLTKMSVEELVVAIHKCWSASEARRQLDQHQIGLDTNESKAVMYLAELTRRTEVAKDGCAFCNDCDAVRCPPSQRQLLFKMSEQSGKRNWWNVLHYSMEFHRAVISLLHQDLNATREAALAAKGVGQ